MSVHIPTPVWGGNFVLLAFSFDDCFSGHEVVLALADSGEGSGSGVAGAA